MPLAEGRCAIAAARSRTVCSHAEGGTISSPAAIRRRACRGRLPRWCKHVGAISPYFAYGRSKPAGQPSGARQHREQRQFPANETAERRSSISIR